MSDEEPAPKRLKGSPTMAAPAATEGVVDIHADGDVLLVVKGIAGVEKPISIRVSSHALAIGSSVFKRLLGDSATGEETKTLQLLDDDGDSLLLLCNILHLRNDALPARLQPTALLAFVRTAIKYNAVVAASRSVIPWLDSIYHSKTLQFSDPILIFKMLEGSYLLDDPVYFARFSTRWIVQQALGQTADQLVDGFPGRKRLAAELISRQKEAINALKADLDLIVDACAEGIADDNKHRIDYAPGADPTPEDLEEGDDEPEPCTTDASASTTYLASLRDANIWPATRWSSTLSVTIDRFEKYRIPILDASSREQCHFCVDVEGKFKTAVMLVKEMHKERLWGLCLDCYKHGGLCEGECRYEHVKGKAVAADMMARHLSASIQSSRDGQGG